MPGARLRRLAIPLAPALSLAWATPCGAEERAQARVDAGSGAPADRFELSARSETYLRFFQRALEPGPNGAIVEEETAVPIHEYLFVSARGADTPWDEDSVDLEFAAWGRIWPTNSSYERPFDGDVQTASVRYDGGPAWVRLGRQQVAGGAARFARFDGAMIGARDSLGFFAEGYAGYGVLPRWNGRPGYHHLGSAEGELLEDTAPPEERGTNWLAGGRLGYSMPHFSGSLSFHEQHETGGLAQRGLGLDIGAEPVKRSSLGARALFELDSQRFANVRLFGDITPVRPLDIGVELGRTEPALLLSRQSVLSVFTTDGYEEAGGRFALRTAKWLRFEGNGFVQGYDGTGPGARGELATRFAWGRLLPTVARIAYARVIAPENGYQSVRLSLGREFSRHLGGTLEAYGYFYDEAIRGYQTSSVYAATLTCRWLEPLELLWGGSIASSPYAAFDAQTLLRAVYHFESRGPAPTRRQ